MAIRNRFQYEVATGRMTLPVAILIALLVWGSTCREWTELVSMALCAAGTYLLIELNTTFALIHTRTTLPSALFLTLYAFCPFLHAYTPAVWLPVLFLGILFALFQSYEAFYASTPVYHAFLLLGLGSLAIPPVLYLIPLIYIAMGDLRSFSARTFFAGLVGIATPYLFLLSYHLYLGNLESACDTLLSSFRPMPIDYSILSLEQAVSGGIVLLIILICSVRSLMATYQEKVQTRIMLRTLLILEAGILLLLLLQPHLFNALFPLLIALGALPCGHLFAQTYNRFTRIFFSTALLLILMLGLFNLWMHLFSF